MSDPVSTAASIAGLVALADIVFIRCVRYIKCAKGAKDDAKSLCDSLQNLCEVLHSLGLHAARLDANAGPQLTTTPDSRLRLISSCNQLLGRIRRELEKNDPSECGFNRAQLALRQLKWPFSASDVKGLSDQLEQHKSTLSLALSADTNQALQEVLSAHRSFQNELLDIKYELAKQRQEFAAHLSSLYSKEEITGIFSFFGSESPEPRHKTSQKLRHPETGLWLLEDPDYLAWTNGLSPRIWLTGIPGAGKTVLASLIIEEAWTEAEVSRSAVAYFYCDYKDSNTQDPVKILGSLATQLARQSMESFQLLRQLYNELHPTARMPAPVDLVPLVEAIRQMSSTFEDVSVILDGLDECGDSTLEVIKSVRNAFSTTKHGRDVRIAFLSRSEQLIQAQLEEECVHIQISARSEDLRLFVATEMQRRINEGTLEVNREGLKAEIVKTLVEGAEGMFRWVVCQMDYLSEQADDHDRWMALKSLPPGLHETYERILMRVNSRSPRIRTLVQRTFRWLIYAKRRLQINELCVAVSIDPEMQRLDMSRRPTIRTLLTHCSSLVRLSNDGGYLELAHFTVQEFLTAQSTAQSPQLAPYMLTENASHVELSRTCLTYLNLANFDTQPLENVLQWGKWLQSLPFREYCVAWFEWYATNYWDDDIAFSLMTKLFQPMKSRKFLRLAQDIIILALLQHFGLDYLDSETVVNASGYQDSSPLHIAAWLQITPLCSWLIDQGCSVNEQSSFGSPLHFAMLGKDVYLFKAVSTTSFRDKCFTMGSRKADVLRILAEAGADGAMPYIGINNQAHSLLSLLFNLSLESDRSLVPLFVDILLSAKAQADESFFDCAEELCNLRFATGVRLVLDCLLAEHVKDGLSHRFVELCQRTSCSAHLRSGRSQAGIRLSQAESSDNDFRRLRLVSSTDRWQALVETLESYSIDVNITESASGDTLLHAASDYGSYRCATVLLRSGVDIGKRNHKGESALHKCAINLNGAVVSLLLDYGAQTNDLDSNGCSIYHLAAAKGNTQILRTLCEHPRFKISDLSKRNNDGLTPALVAAEEMSGDAFQYLLTVCNDLSGTSAKSGWGVVHFCSFLSLHAFRAVLSLDVDLNLRDKQDQTALHICCKYSIPHRPEKVSLLIDKGLDPCATDDQKRTPLHAFLSSDAFVTLSDFHSIIDKVADESAIQIKDADGNLPIRLFLGNLKERYITFWGLQRLLKGGADLSARDSSGNSCLQLLISLVESGCWTKEEGRMISELILEVMCHPTTSPMVSDATVATEALTWALTRFHEALVIKLLALVGNISEEIPGENGESIFQKCIDSKAPTSILKGLVSKARKGTTYRSSQGSGRTLIHSCCESKGRQRHEYLRILLEAGADVDATCEPHMKTALMLAADEGDTEAIGILLQYGADVTKQDSKSGWTALHYAANWEDPYVLKAFGNVDIERLKPIDFTFDISDLSYYQANGCTLLHLISDFPTTLEYLLDRCGPLDLNCRDDARQTPLHLASIVGNIHSARVLVSNGADVSAQDMYQKAALHYACIYQRPEMVNFLIIQGSECELKDSQGRSPLHYAAEHGFKDIAQQLVEHKCKQFPDSAGCSPELLALMHNHSELAEFLREARTTGIEQRAYISGVCTALSDAVLAGERDTVIQLLDCGISMDYGHDGCCGCSPLLIALEARNPDLADLLISKGVAFGGEACRNSAYPGASAVHLALLDDSLTGALRTILSKGIAGDLHLSHAIHPLHFAIARENNGGLKLLLQHYLGLDDASFSKESDCISNKHTTVHNTVHLVLNVPISLANYRGPHAFGDALSIDGLDGCSPLHVAATVGNEEAARILIQLGADVESRDRQLQTPLHKAAGQGSISVIKHLLDFGTNLQSCDVFEYTPALWAVYAGQLEAFVALEQYGPDMCRGSITEDRFLEVALVSSRSEMLAYLLQKGYRPTAGPFGVFITANARDSVASFPSLVLNSQLVMGVYANHIWDLASWNLFIDTRLSFFNKLLKRIPSDSAARETISTRRSTDIYSPLCCAAVGGHEQIMDLLIGFGADINEDGCKFGPPLMAACNNGHLAVVANLIRRGAEMTYFDGEKTISAVKSADYFPRIQHWLLVDRFTEQRKISHASEESGQAAKGYWAGPQAFRIPLTRQFGRFGGESTLDHACRLSRLRRDFEGEILSWPAGAEHPFICLQ